MTAEELQVGMAVTILVVVKGKKLEFPVTVTEKKGKDIILTTIVEKNNKIISFDGYTTHLMVDSINAVPQLFRSVKIKSGRNKKKELFYAVKIFYPSVTMNRRGAYRCYVGEQINVLMNANHKTYDGVLKDVSATGFAIVFDKSELPEGYEEFDSCHAVYNEFMAEICFNVSLNLTGKIVRITDVGNGKVVFGCKSLHISPVIEKYIARKEQLALKRKMENERTEE